MLNIIKKIYAWLLPYTCILCGYCTNRMQDICHPCLQTLPILTQSCIKCANLLLSNNLLCGECLHKHYAYDRVYALFIYQAPIAHLVIHLKFHRHLIYARVLGELLAIKLKTKWYASKPLPTLIIPMPLHPKRLKERGFNQALEISRPVSRILNLPIDSNSCQRIIHTAPQATLAAKKRQKNVRNAFKIMTDFTNCHIAVVDDVITTGSTIAEFCQALKLAGAAKIDVWCCARAIK